MHHLPVGTVTLLFTDIEGSTYLLEQLGERYPNVLAEYRSLLRITFHANNGHEVDTQGDSFFVAFARATDAVSAAVEIQRTLFAHAWPNGVKMRVRIGLHTGEPQLSAEGYVGLDVHHAARTMSAGHGGQVLLSATTCELVKHDLPDGVSLRDLGERRLKDLQHPGPLFQLLIVDLPTDFPPLKTLDSHPNNLPVQPTPFIGRDQQVAAILRLLSREEVRLLTLTGPGGTGKTRLGLQVAAELSDTFTDGVYFVNLAPLSDSQLVVPTIAQTLGLKEAAGQPLLDLLKGSLHWKHLLLVLDNFEQVVEAAVDVAGLLAACSNLKVLVTSRMSLHVRGEQEFAVPPLAVPDPRHLPDLVSLSQYEAVALFISRSQSVKPEFQVSDANAPAIAEICVRLDGLPLAIELAAARIKLLPPQALLARLGQRLAVLTGGARDAPARQQTLRNTITWSYDLLDAQEQRLFRWLSVFVGGCTLEAAEAVCSTLEEGIGVGMLLDGVTSLLDKSLLQQEQQADEEPRLLLLETIREYGLECLSTSMEMEATRSAHALYYLALVERSEPEFGGPHGNKAIIRLEHERENLRAAIQWLFAEGERESALRFCTALQQFWSVRGSAQEGLHLLEQALLASDGVQATVRARALSAACQLAIYFGGSADRFAPLVEESLALSRAHGDQRGIAEALMLLGQLASEQGNFEESKALYGESLTIRRALKDREGIAEMLFHQGEMYMKQGEFATASEQFAEEVEIGRDLGDPETIAGALFYLGFVAHPRNDYTRARNFLQESLELYREVKHQRNIGMVLEELARVAFLQGDQVAAAPLAEESLAIAREVDDKLSIVSSLSLLGEVILNQGDTARASTLVEESVALAKEVGNRRNLARSLSTLAKVAAHQGDLATARTDYRKSIAIVSDLGLKLYFPASLEGLASVVSEQGELLWAARLWGAAESLREAMGASLPPVYRTDYERSVAAARVSLGEQALAKAWAEGRMMTQDQALPILAWAESTPPVPPPETPSRPVVLSPPPYPDGLTAREVAVLRFVARGMTNDQVAEQLVISPRTVNTHLTSIFSKIGVSTRSAATRYAINHNII